jgi:hypothetical protein
MSLEHASARHKRGRKPRKVDPEIFVDRWLDPEEAAAFLGLVSCSPFGKGLS